MLYLYTAHSDVVTDKAGGHLPDETPKHEKLQALRRSSRTSSEKAIRQISSPFKNGNIRSYLMQVSNDPPPSPDLHASRNQLPLSDDYKVDDGIFDDVEMQDAPSAAVPHGPSVTTMYAADKTVGSSDTTESFEDRYQTPPDSPSKISESQRARPIPKQQSPSVFHTSSKERQNSRPKEGQAYEGIISSPVTKRQDHLTKSLEQSRKRSFPELPKPDLPRKVSRDNADHRSASVNQVQPITGTRNVGDAEFHVTRSNIKGRTRSFQKSCSTGSLTSMSSSGATMATSAWTTPNTSFLTETPATSFSSSNEPFELDNLGREALHARQSWQNLKAPFGLGLDMSMDLNIPDVAEVVSMGPPAYLPAKRNPEVSVKQLLSVSPFGKSLDRHYRLITEKTKPQHHQSQMLLFTCVSCTNATVS